MLLVSPEFSIWKTLVGAAEGEVLEKSLECWQKEVRQSLGISTTKPIVIVGHQPTFFHPGILAKFIAANRLVQEIDGELIYLVVDHHKGTVGCLKTPQQEVEVAILDPEVAMIDQQRVEACVDIEPFATALHTAVGKNAAMQFANAAVHLMAPWVSVHHVIASSELLQTPFGKAVVNEMQTRPQLCIDAYNSAAESYPDSRFLPLQEGELPIWNVNGGLRPRALLLTLLARLVAGDLFVHGTGGMEYDSVMEQWCHSWLGCSPCNAVMATATLRLKSEYKSVTDARREYHSPSFDVRTKGGFLKAIKQASYQSTERQIQFQKMHCWLQSVQPPLDLATLKHNEELSLKRDWAFPLYPMEQLNSLYEEINAL